MNVMFTYIVRLVRNGLECFCSHCSCVDGVSVQVEANFEVHTCMRTLGYSLHRQAILCVLACTCVYFWINYLL